MIGGLLDLAALFLLKELLVPRQGWPQREPTGNQTTFPWVNHVILAPNRAFAKEHVQLPELM